jgi:hypothetical protein
MTGRVYAAGGAGTTWEWDEAGDGYNPGMTSKDIEGELFRDPFVPLRLQLVSGKTLGIPMPGAAWILRNALLVFQDPKPGRAMAEGYDVIAFRNIERIEQRVGRRKKAG